jgi:hypothetical protein
MAERDPNSKPDYGMPVHPVCDLFPLIEGDDFLALCGDIQEHGLVNPIVIHEGQIVDGRNRFLACEDMGVKPRFIEWRVLYRGSMTVTRWIWSINVARRHLTIEQILALEIAVRGLELKEQAHQREIAGKSADGTGGGRGHKLNPVTNRSQGLAFADVPPQEQRAPAVRKQIATEVGVSERKVQQALNVQNANPALLKQVAQGKTTLREAAKQVQPPTPVKVADVPESFDIARAIGKVVKVIDSTLATCPAEVRPALVAGLRKALEAK